MYRLIRPLLFAQDAEKAHERMHRLGSFLGRSRLKKGLRFLYHYKNSRLHQSIHGIDFANPVGLAAGFDKTADLIDLVQNVGFGYTEIGSVTALARAGNPRPRLFRLPADHAIVNRMGLNNRGADATASVIAHRTAAFPLGVNIAKTHDPEILGDKAIEDFVYSFVTLYPFCDFMTINVSCPNTAEGKTFEEVGPLEQLLSALRKAQEQFDDKKPMLIKFSPDRSMQEIDALLRVTEKYSVEGYVVGNTSSGREGLKTSQERLEEIANGGVSGEPVRESSTQLIAHIYQKLNSPLIIGVGGVFTAQHAYDKIRAGASLVQAYTGLVYEGPAFAKNVNRGLVELLTRDGFTSVKEAVGADVKEKV